jgi:protein tyrosine/serine phosphatase
MNSVNIEDDDRSHLNLPALHKVKALIPNLHFVSPNLLRGAQPNEEALLLLKQSGIKTIINLRNEGFLVEQEKAQAHSLGLNYVNIPMDVFTKPSTASLEKFLATANDSANQPVYVHCLHGEDRTGTMCAIYRMNHQGWKLDHAYSEMVSLGFKPYLTQLSEKVYEYGHADGADKSTINPAAAFVDDMRERVRKFMQK